MKLVRLSRRLGVRALLMTLLAVGAAFLAPMLDPFIPSKWLGLVNEDAVLPILTILASSMLAVTTFSLSVMVQAFQSASSQATPRAYRILMQDTTTQSVLATFVGSFLFSLTAVALFHTQLYGPSSTVVMFILTTLVIINIIVALLRWIDHLSLLGSMDYTLHLVEESARSPLRTATRCRALGAVPADTVDPAPKQSKAIKAPKSGYIQYIDLPGIQSILTSCDARMWLAAHPGAFLLSQMPLARLDGGPDDLPDRLTKFFTIGKTRTLEQDARHGLMVMAEIGSRALSPGVNDPGTAIDVINRLTALLSECVEPPTEDPRFDRIISPHINAEDLVRDAFEVIARDGADRLEVITKLVDGLKQLRQSDWDEMRCAADMGLAYVMEHARIGLASETDLSRLEQMS